ncbi:MAG: beta-L-arabinofuranosidase domain-containing protein [Acidobacteriota bacterium]
MRKTGWIFGFFLIGFVTAFMNCQKEKSIWVVKNPPVDEKNDHYTSNREPLLRTPFIKMPVGMVKPKGWLLKQLELQAKGFHGNLSEISKFLKKENNAWLDPEGKGERGWEEEPYWLKGFGNCGYLLGDERMIKESRTWIEGALNSQQPDGWFGPAFRSGGAATKLKGRTDLWPNMIMLFCLQDYYEYTGSKDERVISLMTNYFKSLFDIPDEDFLVGYWPRMRAGDMLYSVIWLYNRTGDEWLLDFARKVHRNTAEWERDVINWHNVNISQGFGEPATYFQVSKSEEHLKAAERNWQKVKDLYGQVPGGMFGGDENCREGYTGPRQAVETCGMVEMMLSEEVLLMISGDIKWADRCEDVAFNSYPASMTPDLKALRYLTAPNLVVSDSQSKAPGFQNGGPMLWMNPHRHRCCQHNSGHGWPYFTQHLWAATHDNGLGAVIYAPSEVKAAVGDGTQVIITEKTNYPFDEKIEFEISTPQAVEFPLYLRVPGWCHKAGLEINGKEKKVSPEPASYICINRKWQDRDQVNLTLFMDVRITHWTKNLNCVSINRGPLTYSLKIGEKYIRHGGTDKWPAWEIYPTTDWNYGLLLKDGKPESGVQAMEQPWPEDDQPFKEDSAPLEIKLKARKIPEWQLDHLGLVGEMQPSPVKTEQPVETITLVPMGCARLRISAFPYVLPDGSGHEWEEPKKEDES